MLFALVTVSALGIFVFIYNKVSMQSQFQAYREEQSILIKQILTSAAEEAIVQLQKKTDFDQLYTSQNTSFYEWLLGKKDSVDIPLPETEKFVDSSGNLKSGQSLVITAKATHLFHKTNDSKGTPYSKFSLADGSTVFERVGTLKLEIQASIAGAYLSKNTILSLVRFHDFRVVSMVSPRDSQDKRTCYVGNFPLDYALLVRYAYDERIKTPLNFNPDVNIIIDQKNVTPGRRGKVYLGHPGGKYVSVNTNKYTKKVIPQICYNFPAGEFYRIGLQDCIQLDDVIAQKESILSGMEGIFYHSNEPAVKDVGNATEGEVLEAEKLARFRITNDNAPSGAIFTGLDILGRDDSFLSDSYNAKEILEGDIRQRFFYFSHFRFDLSKCDTVSMGDLESLATETYHLPCIPYAPVGDVHAEQQMKGFKLLDEEKPHNTPPLISFFSEQFPYMPNMDPFATPTLSIKEPVFRSVNNFYDISSVDNSGDKTFRPYGHFNLFNQTVADLSEAERIGIYDPRTQRLRLRGIVAIKKSFIIGNSSIPYLTIEGQGVLVCTGGGIDVFSGLRKRPNHNDLCVLVARKGNITVHTSELIEASLISVSNNTGNPFPTGAVIAKKPLNLHGAMVVDILDTQKWIPGEHYLRYDEYLKQFQPVLAVNFSPRITFERIMESEL
ncbi:MAG: hypothetical protein HQM10_08130 [Candidatus Riflebacteria bacterium]|nr:hypothetical protein [Candidatus Riflebacteria bacterium]